MVDLGRPEDALESYDRALAHRPKYVDALINRANTLRLLGRHDEALTSFDRAVLFKPDHAEGYLGHGNALLTLKRLAEAVHSYDRAIALAPAAVDALANRGRALRELKRYDESLSSYDRALSIKSDDAALLVGRGNTHYAMKSFAAALADYDRAVTIRPDFAEAHGNRGNALREMGRHGEALDACNRALALKPDYNEGYNNRGNALIELNRPADALADYDRALEAAPDNVYAWVNRGNALRYLDRAEEAIESFDRAIALAPDLAEAHWNKGLLCLSVGDFARGWAGYEWRWRREGELQPRDFTQPQWRGETLAGKTILLHAEQGFGDSIQFIRYLPMVAEKGGKIILEIPDGLVPLVGMPRTSTASIAVAISCRTSMFIARCMSLAARLRHDDRHHSGVGSVSPCTRQARQGLAGSAGGPEQATDRSRLVGKANPQERPQSQYRAPPSQALVVGGGHAIRQPATRVSRQRPRGTRPTADPAS